MVALREGDDKTVAPGPHSPPTVLDHESDSASDWLASDDDEEEGGLRGGQTRLSTGPGLENIGDSSAARRDDDGERDMGAREMDKVQRKHYDEGYREGISAGKEAMIQPGFDAGFAKHGAPPGRALGQVRGTLHALSAFLGQRQAARRSRRWQQRSAEGEAAHLAPAPAAIAAHGHGLSDAPAASSPRDEDGDAALAAAVTRLLAEAQRLRLDDVVEQDWEALEHERAHVEEREQEDQSTAAQRPLLGLGRETSQQRREREGRIPALTVRADALVAEALSRSPHLPDHQTPPAS